MNKFYRALLVWIAFGVVVGLCPAPIPDPRPTPPPVPEQSQEQLAEQQKFNGVQPEVGRVQTVLSSGQVDPTAPDFQAVKNLSNADKTQEEALARENLITADEVLKSQPKSPVRTFLLGLMVLLVAAAGVVGFRVWADKNIPVPEPPRSKTRW